MKKSLIEMSVSSGIGSGRREWPSDENIPKYVKENTMLRRQGLIPPQTNYTGECNIEQLDGDTIEKLLEQNARKIEVCKATYKRELNMLNRLIKGHYHMMDSSIRAMKKEDQWCDMGDSLFDYPLSIPKPESPRLTPPSSRSSSPDSSPRLSSRYLSTPVLDSLSYK